MNGKLLPCNDGYFYAMGAMEIISLAVASQGIFLSAILFFRRRRYPAVLALSTYLLLFSCGLLEVFHDRASSGKAESVVFSFIGNANLLYGPLLYFFVRLLLVPKVNLAGLALHFLPFVIFFCGDLLVIFKQIQLSSEAFGILDFVLFEFFVLQLLTYSIVTVRLFKNSRSYLLQTYSNFDRRDVDALYLILRSIIFVYLLSFSLSHLFAFGIVKNRGVFISVQVLIAFVTYYLGYHMYLRPTFLSLQLYEPKNDKGNGGKYKRSGLNESDAKVHVQQLLSYMESAKPYKTPDITVYDLALALNISRNHLTEILNIYLGVNFYEFINNYRIEESKRLILDTSSSHLSMAGIASEASFRSTAAFYSNFRKLTGTTPLNWKSDQQQKPNLGIETR